MAALLHHPCYPRYASSAGVRWMWQLHKQGAGGVVGDEMGLGKTVQVQCVDEGARELGLNLSLSLFCTCMPETRGCFRLLKSRLECRVFNSKVEVAAILTAPCLCRANTQTGGSFSRGPPRQQRDAPSYYLVSRHSPFALDGRAARVGATA